MLKPILTEPIQKRNFIFLFQFAFPNPQYHPTSRFKHSGYFLVVFYIPFPLLLPVFLMFGGTSVPAVMSMPEATVNKHGYFLFGERKIRVSFYGVIAPPPGDPILLENLYQPKFGGLILFRLNAPHNVRSFFFVKNIRQNCHLVSKSMRRLGSVSDSSTILL